MLYLANIDDKERGLYYMGLVQKNYNTMDNGFENTEYNITINNHNEISVSDYPLLKQVGRWIKSEGTSLSCSSYLDKKKFELKFMEITGLKEGEFTITAAARFYIPSI